MLPAAPQCALCEVRGYMDGPLRRPGGALRTLVYTRAARECCILVSA
jgi:hypothetical protein